MDWALAAAILIFVALVSRRLLRLDEASARSVAPFCLSREREELYQPVAQEIDTQTVILGISLNEALAERQKGNAENARRLVGLAVCQWNRLAENVTTLLDAIEANIPSARSMLRIRSIEPHRFKSRTMIDFLHMRDALDQLVFRSKIRYQMTLRVLRRAIEGLSSDFRNAFRTMERPPYRSCDAWELLDPAFHDFDLVIKESLLSFRSFLVALPDSALDDFGSDLRGIVSRSVRSTAATKAV
jgi:hypothetical protein